MLVQLFNNVMELVSDSAWGEQTGGSVGGGDGDPASIVVRLPLFTAPQ
jgi:hypothetical protein